MVRQAGLEGGMQFSLAGSIAGAAWIVRRPLVGADEDVFFELRHKAKTLPLMTLIESIYAFTERNHCYSERNASATGRRAARKAGKIPPTTPMIKAKMIPITISTGVTRNAKAT